jgi:hypothetical protein
VLHAAAGFLAGFVHVLSGPDHLAAVAPLAASRPRGSGRAGALWGAGHASGVALVAVAALALRDVLPIERLAAFSERLVGVVLIGIGLWGLRLALGSRLHTHEHLHEGQRHLHLHVHRRAHEPTLRAHAHTHAAFGVGVIHGLAGSAHFFGVLPALALPTTADALLYVGAFGLGTVAAMTAWARGIGVLAARSALGPERTYRVFLGGCAGLAVVVGSAWLVR